MATTAHDKLNELIRSGHATCENVKWGSSYREVVILEGKQYQNKEGHAISRLLNNNIYSMYIDMPATSSNQNIVINDILSEDVGDSADNARLTRRQRIERRKTSKLFNALLYVTNTNLNKHER